MGWTGVITPCWVLMVERRFVKSLCVMSEWCLVSDVRAIMTDRMVCSIFVWTYHNCYLFNTIKVQVRVRIATVQLQILMVLMVSPRQM